MTTAYAIWAPGVGYMTHERYTYNPAVRAHSHDIGKAQTFADITELLAVLRDGVTDMTGLQIRRLEQAGWRDLGQVS